MQENAVNIIWFRRDLRLHDNTALYHALNSGKPVVPIFIFDRNILDQLEDRFDRRVEFIHATLLEMQGQLSELKTTLEVYHGYPLEVFKSLLKKYAISSVFANHDYEPYALERDQQIQALVASSNSTLKTYKDHVVFEKDEIIKDNQTPYTVFTPYSKRWKATLDDQQLQPFNTRPLFKNFYKQPTFNIPALSDIGFEKTSTVFPSKQLEDDLIIKYGKTRDFPGLASGTSRLGVHLRFGTVSIRQLVDVAKSKGEVFLNELIWREFYQMILWHFPQVGRGRAIKPQYEKIEFRNNEAEFELWCAGQTGYPIVDAGMRELNATGFMHNRVRMIVASFLTKHLLIEWRWGEAYFAQKLLDYELASNNGGWQWASGSGCDAAPYFRVFNPELQMQKFDKGLSYVRKWVPEFESASYPKPIVNHAEARKRALEVYGKALRSN